MDRLVGSWVPYDIKAWPFDEDHFGTDVSDYEKRASTFLFNFVEDGTGTWSLGLLAGTLRVIMGKQPGHFLGDLLVTDSDVDASGWRAKFEVSLEPGKRARFTWRWQNGPTKNKATVTTWEQAEPIVTIYGRSQQCCALM